MSRYIDADKIIQISSDMENNCRKFGSEGFAKHWDFCKHILESAPRVDAVEVIRCKDCIYYHREIHECEWFSEEPDCLTTGSHVETDDNDFCSYGERRKGDGTIH